MTTIELPVLEFDAYIRSVSFNFYEAHYEVEIEPPYPTIAVVLAKLASRDTSILSTGQFHHVIAQLTRLTQTAPHMMKRNFNCIPGTIQFEATILDHKPGNAVSLKEYFRSMATWTYSDYILTST